MPKVKTIELSESQRMELEKGYREGKSHAYRKRCHLVLLKSEARKSVEVARILGCCEVSVNNWLKRYEAEGISGLATKSGRGRKAILDGEDLESVKRAVQMNRQRLSIAKAELEAELEKSFSTKTLERYIKNSGSAL